VLSLDLLSTLVGGLSRNSDLLSTFIGVALAVTVMLVGLSSNLCVKFSSRVYVLRVFVSSFCFPEIIITCVFPRYL
jgi:hypothetical protein